MTRGKATYVDPARGGNPYPPAPDPDLERWPNGTPATDRRSFVYASLAIALVVTVYVLILTAFIR